MKNTTADLLYGLAGLAVSFALFAHTFDGAYEFNPLIESVSTVFFPRILLGAIALCSLGLVIKGAISRSDDHLPTINVSRLLQVLTAAAATTAGIWFIGYFYVMPVGTFLIGWVLGYRRWLILIIVSLVAPILVWIALGHFADVSFPTQFRLL